MPGNFLKCHIRSIGPVPNPSTVLTNPFLNSLWPGMLAWSILYISDYALTLICARLRRAGAAEKIAMEGSYELTPYFQRDIDSLKLISPRFLAALVWTLSLLALIWVLAASLSLPELYYFALGIFILLELAIHVRHIRNLFLFWSITHEDHVRGRIEYSRSLSYRMSSYDLLAFSGLFLLLFAFTQNWFVLGGAISCLSTAVKHRRLAKQPRPVPAAVPASQQT